MSSGHLKTSHLLAFLLIAGLFLHLVQAVRGQAPLTLDLNSKSPAGSLSLAHDLFPRLQRLFESENSPRRLNRLHNSLSILLRKGNGEGRNTVPNSDSPSLLDQARILTSELRDSSNLDEVGGDSVKNSIFTEDKQGDKSYILSAESTGKANNLYDILKESEKLQGNSIADSIEALEEVLDSLKSEDGNNERFGLGEKRNVLRSGLSSDVRGPDELTERVEERGKRQQGWYIQYGKRGVPSDLPRSGGDNSDFPLLTPQMMRESIINFNGHSKSSTDEDLLTDQLNLFLSRLMNSSPPEDIQLSTLLKLDAGRNDDDDVNGDDGADDMEQWLAQNANLAPVSKRQQGWYTQYGKRSERMGSS